MEQISIMLPKKTIEELNLLSESENLPRSNLIRFAILQYLEKKKEGEALQKFVNENFEDAPCMEEVFKKLIKKVAEKVKREDNAKQKGR